MHTKLPQLPIGVHDQLKVCGASSGTATAVNCCTRFCPTVTVNGVTITETDMTAIGRVPVTEESDVNVAVTVAETGDVGAW